jgi:ribonuclease Z
MKIELVVVSGRTLDTEPSFFLQIDSISYLFNIPDGTQRLFMQYRWKFIQIKQLFLTSHHPESMSGIFGALETLSHTSTSKFGITADSRTKRSIIESSTLISSPELLPTFTSDYVDDNLTVIPIPLTQTIAYRVQLRDYIGRFLPENAKQLGVPAGPLFKKLATGQNVTLEDGRVINKEDVMTPPTPGDVILVVDCKSIEDFGLLRNVSFENVTFVVHFTCQSILNTEEYLSLFPYDRQKHVCFIESGRISYGSIAELYSKITKSSLCSSPDGIPPPNFVNGYTGLIYQFTPRERQKFVNSLNIQAGVECQIELPVFSTFAVTILGTGARTSQKMRNASGILVHGSCGFVVLDVGNNFLGQLRRKYGLVNTEFILANLKMIWISHMHGDHCFGLYQLLYERVRVTDRVIPVIMNDEIINYLQTNESFFEDGFFKVELM